MKALLISSLQETTPPDGYGGTERFVHWLSEELTNLGVPTTVVCKTGSKGGIYEKFEVNSQTDFPAIKDFISATKPDLIHLHARIPELLDYLKEINCPVVITLHNNFRRTSKWIPLIREFPSHFYLTTISGNLAARVREGLLQNDVELPQKGITNLSFGMDVKRYSSYFNRVTSKDYFLYLGVIGRYKSVFDLAKIVNETEHSFRIVGPTHTSDQKTYLQEILAYCKENNEIQYLGETKGELQKIELLLGAKALLIATGYDPQESDCYEAFGLAMLESNALGVPVIGYTKGNVKDYIVDGINGFLFSNISAVPDLMDKVTSTNLSESCLKHSQKFDIAKIAPMYRDFYLKTLVNADSKS